MKGGLLTKVYEYSIIQLLNCSVINSHKSKFYKFYLQCPQKGHQGEKAHNRENYKEMARQGT